MARVGLDRRHQLRRLNRFIKAILMARCQFVGYLSSYIESRCGVILVMHERIFNFSAGPAVQPLSVLERAQKDLVSFPGAAMSVLEMSHRSAPFDKIIKEAEADLRMLLGIPENYKVLFLQGGASLQFTMVPMNLLPKGKSADYILTGSWSQLALKEAKKLGGPGSLLLLKTATSVAIPAQDELKCDPMRHTCTSLKHTIFGTHGRRNRCG